MNSTIAQILIDMKSELVRINNHLDDMIYYINNGLYDSEDINVMNHMFELLQYDMNELKEEIEK